MREKKHQALQHVVVYVEYVVYLGHPHVELQLTLFLWQKPLPYRAVPMIVIPRVRKVRVALTVFRFTQRKWRTYHRATRLGLSGLPRVVDSSVAFDGVYGDSLVGSLDT